MELQEEEYLSGLCVHISMICEEGSSASILFPLQLSFFLWGPLLNPQVQTTYPPEVLCLQFSGPLSSFIVY
jgi:hypothetical protein